MDKSDGKFFLETVSSVAKLAGDRLKTIAERRVNSDAGNDVKLQEDVESEIFIREKLEATGIPVVGEERGGDASLLKSDTLYWVVDPIDGTSDFARGMRLSAISVGLVENEEEIFGVVYCPYTEEVFHAAKGQGAYCNQERIHVSQRDFRHALLFTAFSVYEKRFAPQCEKVLFELYPDLDDFRRLGTASLELCYLAAGRGELYFELRLFPWDWTAAAVIIREAGGCIGSIDSASLCHNAPTLVVAANHQENFLRLKQTVQKHVPALPYTE